MVRRLDIKNELRVLHDVDPETQGETEKKKNPENILFVLCLLKTTCGFNNSNLQTKSIFLLHYI